MPTYEYVCPNCKHHFEQFQSMSDPPLKKCPKCKKTGVKRLIGSGAGLIFKGTGFYITDYKKKTGAPKEDGGSKEPSADKTPAPAGPEAKPASGDTKSGGGAKAAAPAKTGTSAKSESKS